MNIQLIAMSATLPNLKEIAVWLDSCLYVTHFRPVVVKEYMKIGNELITFNQLTQTAPIKLTQTSVKVAGDRIGLYPLIEQTIKDNGSILVFCQSKNMCEQLCSGFMEPVM